MHEIIPCKEAEEEEGDDDDDDDRRIKTNKNEKKKKRNTERSKTGNKKQLRKLELDWKAMNNGTRMTSNGRDLTNVSYPIDCGAKKACNRRARGRARC